MEEKDIQALFSYMKNNLTLECKSTKLTRSMAEAWCDMFSGYSLEQLKKAARAYAMEKPYWPKPSELVKKLPVMQTECVNPGVERAWPGWPAYGYRDANDYTKQLSAIIAKMREDTT